MGVVGHSSGGHAYGVGDRPRGGRREESSLILSAQGMLGWHGTEGEATDMEGEGQRVRSSTEKYECYRLRKVLSKGQGLSHV